MAEKQDVNLLLDAFDLFNKASNTLETSYNELEKRVKELDVELAEKKNFMAVILECLPVGVIVVGGDGRISTLNATASTILGEEVSELIGSMLIERLLPADGTRDELSKLLVVASPQDEVECDIAGAEGKKKTVSIASTPLKNLSGELTGSLIVVKDISDLKRMRETHERDKRLTAMGEMAASIAHQIRNPLGSIELFASVLNDELREDNKNQKVASEIMRAVKTLNNTLSNMLLFANTSLPQKSSITVGELLGEVHDVCGFMLRESNVSFEIKDETEGAVLNADIELLKQALSNLVMNGAEAAVEGEGAGGGATVEMLAACKGDGLHIVVKDNGPGITEADASRVFDPFFTTKPKGTGLGLAVVNSIVKLHGGSIDVESSNADGTTGTAFNVILPLYEKTRKGGSDGE